MFAHGEPVEILSSVSIIDPYSGEPDGEDWGAPIVEATVSAGIVPGGSLEPVEVARNRVESDFDLLMDAATVVTSSNRVRFRGLTCEVVGRPFLWRHPMTGWDAGLVVQAKIVEG